MDDASTAQGFPCAFGVDVIVSVLLRIFGVAPVQFRVAESKTAHDRRDMKIPVRIRASFNDENAKRSAVFLETRGKCATDQATTNDNIINWESCLI